MLLSYKPLHLEAQQCPQEEGCVVDIGMTNESKRVSLKSENMFFCTTLVLDYLQENSSQNGNAHMSLRRFTALEPSNNPEGTNQNVVNGQRIKHYISSTPINVESNIIQTLTPEEHIKDSFWNTPES